MAQPCFFLRKYRILSEVTTDGRWTNIQTVEIKSKSNSVSFSTSAAKRKIAYCELLCKWNPCE